MEYFLSTSVPVTQPMTKTNDSLSLDTNSIGDGSGNDLCGRRNYYILSPSQTPAVHTFISLVAEPPIIQTMTTNSAFVGTNSVIFRTILEDYPHISVDKTFTVIIY